MSQLCSLLQSKTAADLKVMTFTPPPIHFKKECLLNRQPIQRSALHVRNKKLLAIR